MEINQVQAAVAAIGGVECIGYIQLRNEPFYFVTGEEDPTSEELRYNGIEFDDANGLVMIKRAQSVLRVYPYDQITAILSKEETRAMFPKYDMWAYAQKLWNQTPNRQFEK